MTQCTVSQITAHLLVKASSVVTKIFSLVFVCGHKADLQGTNFSPQGVHEDAVFVDACSDLTPANLTS